MLLVAIIILRISRSHQLKSRIDLARGERAYFTVVKLIKKRSLSTGDINAQMANTLSRLWHNEDCFRLPDGSFDSLSIVAPGRGVSMIRILWLTFIGLLQRRL